MEVYFTPIVSGIVVSLIIIYILIIPIAIFQYRKYDGIMVRRNIVLFSFILYMITAWFMTLLPLPSFDAVAQMPDIEPNLKPFLFVETFLERTNFSLADRSTWIPALKSSSFYTVAFNVLLTVPFGVYLRKYFKVSFWKTILFGCLLSCFYEITQYTGIYGIYPKAYRYADIDDVIVNTLGAGLGYAITPIISRLLPSLEKEKKIYKLGERAGIIRRAVALIVDFFIVNIIYSISIFTIGLFLYFVLRINVEGELLQNLVRIFSYIIVFILIPIIKDGNTFGMEILKIRLLDKDSNYPKKRQIITRNIILILLWRYDEILDKFNITSNSSNITLGINGILELIFMVFFVVYIISIIMAGIKKKDLIIYDKITKTKVIIEE
ncbi:VanZ family protein [Miniphocaeibacter halophilus]|uniref:VanZ family protein n=1 Tax=Miniphocaeibacter halophilus TaxID=2931922 RepID=A0AC61MTH0_9FIRM|nr:VanZ family protein [Miniphocaeibacter halophilus]QQK08822.1 VanZ family protein [Miniphocaeibacter halophilus]